MVNPDKIFHGHPTNMFYKSTINRGFALDGNNLIYFVACRQYCLVTTKPINADIAHNQNFQETKVPFQNSVKF